jgi:hypothetical protein
VVGQTGSMVADAVVGPDNRQMSQTGVADAVVGTDTLGKSRKGVADAVDGTDTLGKSRKGSIVIEAMGLVLDQQLEAVLTGQSARW